MIFMNRSTSTGKRYTSPMNSSLNAEPSQEDLASMRGLVLLEFGATWCGYCLAARSMIDEALTDHPQVRHLRIEDGKGKRLGRIYRVKLWPTLVLLQDGQELARVVRPVEIASIHDLLTATATPPAAGD